LQEQPQSDIPEVNGIDYSPRKQVDLRGYRSGKFYANLQEITSGQKRRDEVAKHMLSGAYASLGKTRMVERNIN
jgi:hypothetical protein